VRIFRIGPGLRTGCPKQPEVANRAKARDGFALVKQSERDQPDIAAAVRALERNPSPTRAISFAHAIREVSCDRGGVGFARQTL
jgi:hypothetical protein